MTPESEIDEVLRRLGGVEPSAGLEQRVSLRLRRQRSTGSIRILQTLAASALAASVTLMAVSLSPALRNRVFHHHTSSQSLGGPVTPREIAPAAPGGFGAAGAVHLPAGPVAVPPTPVNQGRGHSRSGVAVRSTSAPPHNPTPDAAASASGSPASREHP